MPNVTPNSAVCNRKDIFHKYGETVEQVLNMRASFAEMGLEDLADNELNRLTQQRKPQTDKEKLLLEMVAQHSTTESKRSGWNPAVNMMNQSMVLSYDTDNHFLSHHIAPKSKLTTLIDFFDPHIGPKQALSRAYKAWFTKT